MSNQANPPPRALAIVPARGSDLEAHGQPLMLRGRPLLAYTIDAARQARLIDRVMVTTDSPTVRSLAIELGAEAPFLRPAELAGPNVPLEDVLRQTLEWLESHEDYRPTIVAILEASHPVRPVDLIDRVIETLVREDLDTVFTAFEERRAFWELDDEGTLHRWGGRDRETRVSRRPVYRELAGVVLASRADVIRAGQRLGRRVAVVPLPERYAIADTQGDLGLPVAEKILDIEAQEHAAR
jgi:CMP-N-acetylneuraminic acid synthetase